MDKMKREYSVIYRDDLAKLTEENALLEMMSLRYGRILYNSEIRENAELQSKLTRATVNGTAGNDKLYGGSGNDTLYGDDGDDYLHGDDGDDRLHGGRGNDRLYGDNGDDKIYGGSGDDRLYGQDGDDYLMSIGGSDELYGGEGKDIFCFDYGEDENSAVIKDFTSGEDRIEILGTDSYSLIQCPDYVSIEWDAGTVRVDDAALDSLQGNIFLA